MIKKTTELGDMVDRMARQDSVRLVAWSDCLELLEL